jgi:hypothetical protein
MRRGGELAIAIALFAGISALSAATQQPISLHGGQGWDGQVYHRIAEQLAAGERPTADAPFVYRIGVPFLVAACFGDDLLFGFKAVNVVANLVTTLLFVLWLRPFVARAWLRLLLLSLFLTQWHGPTRFVFFYPILVDPWLFASLFLGLIAIRNVAAKPTLSSILQVGFVAGVGATIREAALILPLALLFSSNPILPSPGMLPALLRLRVREVLRLPPIALLLPLAFALGCMLAIRGFVVSATNAYAFGHTAVGWLYDKPMLSYLQAWFIAYGPILVVALYGWRRVFSLLAEHQYLAVFLLGFMTLGWIGGSDTERLLYWACPVVYLLIGIAIEAHLGLLRSLPLVLSFAVAQAFSQRLFWTLPDVPSAAPTPLPILSIAADRFQYLDLYSYFGSRRIEAVSLLEYLVVAGLLLWWLGWRDITAPSPSPSAVLGPERSSGGL